jgi:hypothetical protein
MVHTGKRDQAHIFLGNAALREGYRRWKRTGAYHIRRLHALLA